MHSTVSIVIPAYNHGNYLNEAIRSVLGQDYPNVELIVLDDGSTDNTRKVLAKYGTDFRWETQKNMGQARTLEKGWRMAHGQILGYLSADDVLLPSAVGESVAALTAHQEAVATYCDFQLIDPESRVIRTVKTPDYSYRDMFITVTCPPGPGAFFRRSAYELAGPWNPSYRQMPDYDFWLRLGLYGNFIRIPRVLAAFRAHEASQTFSQTTAERAEEPILILQQILEREELPSDIRAISSVALANAYLVSAQLHVRAGRIRLGGRRLRVALQRSPADVLSPRVLRMVVNALFNRLGHRVSWAIRDVWSSLRRSRVRSL
mgnify:FL=1